jgi:hypothetical protein
VSLELASFPEPDSPTGRLDRADIHEPHHCRLDVKSVTTGECAPYCTIGVVAAECTISVGLPDAPDISSGVVHSSSRSAAGKRGSGST